MLKKTKPKPKPGDNRVRKVFAWDKTELTDGFTVRYRYYYILEVCKKTSFFMLPWGDKVEASEEVDLGTFWSEVSTSSTLHGLLPKPNTAFADLKPVPGVPFTIWENSVMNHLTDAHNEFVKLERCHPCEVAEWVEAIHRLQDLMCYRVAKLDYPDYFNQAT